MERKAVLGDRRSKIIFFSKFAKHSVTEVKFRVGFCLKCGLVYPNTSSYVEFRFYAPPPRSPEVLNILLEK